MKRETNKTWNVAIDSDFTVCDLIIKLHGIRQDNEKQPMLIYVEIKDSISWACSENKVFYGKTIRECLKRFKHYLNNILPNEEIFYIDYNFTHEELFFVPKENQFDDLKSYFKTIKECTILNCIDDYSTNFE